MKFKGVAFEVEKADIKNTFTVEQSVEKNILDGQAILAVDSFSFTANNITYATLGNTLRYWNFFPASSDAKGNIPVWGFADVIASKSEGLAVGQRFYGYYPMASYLVVEPTNISLHGFTDATHHRKALPKIYNQYSNTAADPLYSPNAEALQMLMRPLFTTSFLLADFFDENNQFGAEQLLLTSASSKTAIGTALLLQANKKGVKKKFNLVGLTSNANKIFVEKLGCYDEVITYEDVMSLNTKLTCAIIDFAGNGQLLSDIAKHLDSHLTYVCLVGVSHWDQRQGLEPPTGGPKPVLFFAPTQAEKRLFEWGVAGFHQRLARAWSQFDVFSKPWLSFETYTGMVEIETMYQRVLQGNQAPDTGYICSLGDSV